MRRTVGIGSFGRYHAAALTALAVGFTRPALGDPPSRDVWDARPRAVEAHVGGGTPVGLLGLEGEYSVSSLFAVGVGVGAGLGADENTYGLRGAVLGRVRPVHSSNHAVAIGAAYSLGSYRAPLVTVDTTAAYFAPLVHWMQADLGWEWRSDAGFLLRLSAGAAVMLNPGSVQCKPGLYPAVCGPVGTIAIPTVDLAAGFAF